MSAHDARTREIEVPPFGSPDARWGVEAVLRQALHDLEHGQHVALVIQNVRRALDRWESAREALEAGER
jgi:hypothetical protein